MFAPWTNSTSGQASNRNKHELRKHGIDRVRSHSFLLAQHQAGPNDDILSDVQDSPNAGPAPLEQEVRILRASTTSPCSDAPTPSNAFTTPGQSQHLDMLRLSVKLALPSSPETGNGRRRRSSTQTWRSTDNFVHVFPGST